MLLILCSGLIVGWIIGFTTGSMNLKSDDPRIMLFLLPVFGLLMYKLVTTT